ncbi:tRNA (adenosine(37)-N6)-threonylcarbamoyltransferase complex dimerization subunit type 1 TsaB [Marixanthomonas spongiae]|uniref:N(6)-L-threonylcarbamoyladenine synthase n=1 Tax=Marixanthomonas spongiae TaxID=2174845 RepID=A0A2U0I822_9FLAO|nr:tRNA (adenosine(37)-N6)-threonylcarbamoyltransferase complex dimerization subunit type 1 TsaB [Marixanthomonas spongiae]PVW17252.1 tRNA (adenosine(37)-N6)-threonylcarbamoyltransferase complex dimerization subunit type 1 TsaB [Marixanthomonas spongiae]
MAAILCIETATTNCSVALSVNGSVVAFKEDNPDGSQKGYSHAEKLHGYIEEVLKSGDLSEDKLDAIAVSKGPGSYTGLRIGVSAAKGLCFALDIPLISIATLQSLSLQVKETNAYVVPLLDARRMEVYSAVFSSEAMPNDRQDKIRETKAEILTEDSFSDYLKKGKTVFIGDGVSKFKAICQHPNAVFVEDKLPSAKQMAELSEKKFKKSDFEDVAYFEPYYLKDFIAG